MRVWEDFEGYIGGREEVGGYLHLSGLAGGTVEPRLQAGGVVSSPPWQEQM